MSRVYLQEIPNAPQSVGGGVMIRADVRVPGNVARSLLQDKIPQGAFDGPAQGMAAVARGLAEAGKIPMKAYAAIEHWQQTEREVRDFKGLTEIELNYRNANASLDEQLRTQPESQWPAAMSAFAKSTRDYAAKQPLSDAARARADQYERSQLIGAQQRMVNRSRSDLIQGARDSAITLSQQLNDAGRYEDAVTLMTQARDSGLITVDEVGIGGQSFLHAWEDAENTAMRRGEEFDPNRAYAYATTMAALNTALTFLEFDKVLGPWRKGQSELLGDNLIKLFQSATGAGAVNAVQGGVNDLGATAFGIETRNPFDPERRWDDFTVGTGAGIVLGAGAGFALGRGGKETASPTVQKIVRPDGAEAWQVTDTAGQTREFDTHEEADAYVAKYARQIDLQNITATQGLISFYEQLAQAEGRDVKFELSSLPKTVADAIAAKPESAGQLLDRMKIEGLEGADPAKVSILGETTLEQVQADLYQITIKLHEGATARTVIEETVEGKTREALAQGRISLEWLRSEVEAYQKASGEQLLTGTDQSVIEAVSTLGDAYFAGKVQDRALPGGLRQFLRQLALLFKSAFTRALQLKKAVADGAVSQDFETFLADSVGIPTERQIETRRLQAQERLIAETRHALDPASEITRRAKEPVTVVNGREQYPTLNGNDAYKLLRQEGQGILGEYENLDTGIRWNVSVASLSKMVRQGIKAGEIDGGHAVRVAASYHLPELIKNAKAIEVPDLRSDANLDRLYDLFVPFRWRGETYRLRIKGKANTLQGNKAHSMRVEDIVAEKVPLGGAGAPTTENQPANTPATNGEITLRQLFKGVNPYSGATFSIGGKKQSERIDVDLARLSQLPDAQRMMLGKARERFDAVMEETRDALGMGAIGGEGGSSQPSRDRMIQALGELDAIVSVLPTEARQRLAAKEPTAETSTEALRDQFMNRAAAVKRELDVLAPVGSGEAKNRSVLDQSKSLTYEDAANALRRDQQHPVFKALGSWFRGDFRKIQDEKMPEQTKTLNQFFDKLPGLDMKKPLYRGIQFFNERDRDALVREMSGETWTNKRPFMSASKVPIVAWKQAGRSSYPVLFEIIGSQTGRDIEQFSFIEPKYAWQKEVLFRSGAKFRIVKKPKRIEVEGKTIYTVTLEEIQ